MAFLHEPFRPRLEAEGKFGGGATEAAETKVPGGMLVLTLDDVLSRVPTRALKPGLHDPSRRLHFAMEELLEGISRGRATIMLSKLAERYPETFEAPPAGAEDSPIYLPLQKLIQQIGRATRTPPEKVAPASFEPAPVTPAARAPAAEPAKPEPVEADPIVEAPVTRLLRKLKVMQEPVESGQREAAPGVGAPVASASSDAPTPPTPPTPPAEPPDRAEAEAPRPAVEPAPAAAAGEPEQAVPDIPEPEATPAAETPAPVPVPAPPVETPPPSEPMPVTATAPPTPEAPIATPAVAESKVEPVKVEISKAEEKPLPPLTPPPLPVAPPPPAKVPPPEPPSPIMERAPEVPHSPILENPPANLETNVRLPAGRPLVRPPSLQGPAGLVAPETAPPPAPVMPGFVFAPRQGAHLSDFSNPVYPPETDLPEVHIPPLFAVHPGPPVDEHPAVPEPAAFAPADTAPVAPVLVPPDEEPEAAAEPLAEKTTIIEETPEPAKPAHVSAEPARREEPEEPREDDDDAKERRLSHAGLGEPGAHTNDLLGSHFSLARIDQEPLQAIFMTEEFLDLARVSQLSCGFPGITGCMIVAGDALAQGGERPAGLDAQALCKLTKQLSAVALAFPEELPAVQTYTLHVGNRALSIFARPHVSLCLVHSHRGFLPGVRERLAAVADTLSRGLSGEAEEGR